MTISLNLCTAPRMTTWRSLPRGPACDRGRNEPSPREEEENVDLPSMEQYVRSNIEIIVRTPCILIIILS